MVTQADGDVQANHGVEIQARLGVEVLVVLEIETVEYVDEAVVVVDAFEGGADLVGLFAVIDDVPVTDFHMQSSVRSGGEAEGDGDAPVEHVLLETVSHPGIRAELAVVAQGEVAQQAGLYVESPRMAPLEHGRRDDGGQLDGAFVEDVDVVAVEKDVLRLYGRHMVRGAGGARSPGREDGVVVEEKFVVVERVGAYAVEVGFVRAHLGRVGYQEVRFGQVIPPDGRPDSRVGQFFQCVVLYAGVEAAVDFVAEEFHARGEVQSRRYERGGTLFAEFPGHVQVKEVVIGREVETTHSPRVLGHVDVASHELCVVETGAYLDVVEGVTGGGEVVVGVAVAVELLVTGVDGREQAAGQERRAVKGHVEVVRHPCVQVGQLRERAVQGYDVRA